MRKIFVSAVASSTAVGTFEMRISWGVQACTSIWSYPAPINSISVVHESLCQDLSISCRMGMFDGGRCTIVNDVLQTLRKHSNKFLVDQSSDTH